MSAIYTIYNNTLDVVDSESNPSTHHYHAYIGPRAETGIRDVFVSDFHTDSECPGLEVSLILNIKWLPLVFPINIVTDWNEEEVALLTETFRPNTEAESELESNLNFFLEAVQTGIRIALNQVQNVEFEDTQSDESPEPIPEQFPPEIDMDNVCPACNEDTNILHLGCRHVICDKCIRLLDPRVCPICREPIHLRLVRSKRKESDLN